MSIKLFSDDDALKELCRRYGIERLSLFGSVLKGTATSDSDVDLLVQFQDNARPTFLDIAKIELELSSLLGGRKVDVRTANDLSPYFRETVVTGSEIQYVAG